MGTFCLRNEIEKRLPTDDKFTIALILSCCSYCKKIQNKTEVDKYSKLFIEPLWISLKKDEHALEPVFTKAGKCGKISAWKKKSGSRTRAT